jgi:hypothetical protein
MIRSHSKEADMDSLQRYQLQTERIELIVSRLFPGSILRFGTQDKPLGIQYWVSDSTDHAVLCAFPGRTAVDEVEQMSDEQIEARIRECSTRKPLENYTLTLEFLEDDNPEPVRAIAIDRKDRSSIETWISLEKTSELLSHAYGADQTHAGYYMQQLRDYHVVELKNAAGSLCNFSPMELLQFGFKSPTT